jgi:hypothetical protein
MKLRIYAIFVTVALVAVLTNPSAERHYEKLAQFYPWANESRLADAQEAVWRLSPPSERDDVAASLTRMKATEEPADRPITDHKRWVDALRGRLAHTSWGVFSVVTTQVTDVDDWCATDIGLRRLPRPISLGFLGYVFAKRPPTPEELEKFLEKDRQRLLPKVHLTKLQTRSGQAKAYTFSGKGFLNAPNGSGTNAASFRIQGIRGPILIDTPPRPMDALYKMEALE